MKFPSRDDWRLSREALPIILRVRWHLWRTPFASLHARWRAQVQSELDAALQLKSAGNETHAEDETPDRRVIVEVWACAHAVERVARLVPMASCLTQAMALQLLLARRGQHCAVCIGVEQRQGALNQSLDPSADADATAKPDAVANGSDVADGRFRAHAWVKWNERVLIGGDVRRWKPLTLFASVNAPATAP